MYNEFNLEIRKMYNSIVSTCLISTIINKINLLWFMLSILYVMFIVYNIIRRIYNKKKQLKAEERKLFQSLVQIKEPNSSTTIKVIHYSSVEHIKQINFIRKLFDYQSYNKYYVYELNASDTGIHVLNGKADL